MFQWLFDEAQMRADNVAAPVTPHQWNYIHAMGGALRSSLDNVTAVFAPSCIGHAVLSKREWLSLKIDEISLPTALRCWEHSTRPRKKRHDKLKRSTEATINHKETKKRQDKQQKGKQRETKKKNNNNSNKVERKRLTKAEREERKRVRHEQQKRREERRNRRKNNMADSADRESNLTNAIRITENATDTQHQRKEHKRKRTDQEKQKRKHKKRQRRKKEHNSTDTTDPERELQKEQPVEVTAEKRHNNSKINRRSGVPRVPERCSLRLLERCSWPQCNHSCPTLTNPVTGEEMRFLELLASFGLDIEAVATALGVDMQTLNNMDRTELVNLLTQQVS